MPEPEQEPRLLARRQVRRFIPTRLSRPRSSLPALKNGTALLVRRYHPSCTRIAPDAGVELLHREYAETTQLDALAASLSAGDLVEYRRHDQLHIHHAQMRMAGGKFRNEVRLVNAGSVLTAARCTQQGS